MTGGPVPPPGEASSNPPPDDEAIEVAADESAAASDFDCIISDALAHGLYRTQLATVVKFLRDPRPEARHRHIMAALITHTNSKTGTAFPGYARLAEAATHYGPEGAKTYDERTIRVAISEMRRWGFVVSKRKAVSSGQRAIAHYATTSPVNWEQAITEFCAAMRKSRGSAPEVIARDNVRKGDERQADVTARHNVRHAEVIAGDNPDVIAGVYTVTCKRELEVDGVPQELRTAQAFYNQAAKRHGYQLCEKLPPKRQRRLQERLKEIGGLGEWARAIDAIPLWPFLHGKTRTPGQDPFQLNFDRLLQTDGKLGDVLVNLLEKASTRATQKSPAAMDNIDALWAAEQAKEERR